MLETGGTRFERLLIIEEIHWLFYAEPAAPPYPQTSQQFVGKIENTTGMRSKQPFMDSRGQKIHAKLLHIDIYRPQCLYCIDTTKDTVFATISCNGLDIVAEASGKFDQA